MKSNKEAYSQGVLARKDGLKLSNNPNSGMLAKYWEDGFLNKNIILSDDYIKNEAIKFVAMARYYASGHGYKKGWIWHLYKSKYPANPLTKNEYNGSGRVKPDIDFIEFLRRLK